MGVVEETAELSVATFLDFEKAFNTLRRSYLLIVVKALGMGPEFLKWVKLLYTKSKARVKAGHQISRQFEIGRGTR